jgi:hypothetical protein
MLAPCRLQGADIIFQMVRVVTFFCEQRVGEQDPATNRQSLVEELLLLLESTASARARRVRRSIGWPSLAKSRL